MILKLFDGPMDGAVYHLSREQAEPSTSRKPDGLWFDGKDKHGRLMMEQYKYDHLAEEGGPATMCYVYDGQVVDTGVEFDTEPKGTP